MGLGWVEGWRVLGEGLELVKAQEEALGAKGARGLLQLRSSGCLALHCLLAPNPRLLLL